MPCLLQHLWRDVTKGFQPIRFRCLHSLVATPSMLHVNVAPCVPPFIFIWLMMTCVPLTVTHLLRVTRGGLIKSFVILNIWHFAAEVTCHCFAARVSSSYSLVCRKWSCVSLGYPCQTSFSLFFRLYFTYLFIYLFVAYFSQSNTT